MCISPVELPLPTFSIKFTFPRKGPCRVFLIPGSGEAGLDVDSGVVADISGKGALGSCSAIFLFLRSVEVKRTTDSTSSSTVFLLSLHSGRLYIVGQENFPQSLIRTWSGLSLTSLTRGDKMGELWKVKNYGVLADRACWSLFAVTTCLLPLSSHAYLQY